MSQLTLQPSEIDILELGLRQLQKGWKSWQKWLPGGQLDRWEWDIWDDVVMACLKVLVADSGVACISVLIVAAEMLDLIATTPAAITILTRKEQVNLQALDLDLLPSLLQRLEDARQTAGTRLIMLEAYAAFTGWDRFHTLVKYLSRARVRREPLNGETTKEAAKLIGPPPKFYEVVLLANESTWNAITNNLMASM